MQYMECSSWEEFKNLVETKKLRMQYSDNDSQYDVYAAEGGAFIWHYGLIKDNGVDHTEFETTYKDQCNKPIDIRRDADKPPRVTSSAQPEDTVTYWCGGIIELTRSDTSGYCDFAFDGTVFVQGGAITCADSVFGDYMNAQVLIRANDAVYKTFINRAYITPTGNIDVLSDETSRLPSTAKLRVTYFKKDGDTNPRHVVILMSLCKLDTVVQELPA